MTDAERADLAIDPEDLQASTPRIWLCVSERHAIELAAGLTPRFVQAQALFALESDEELCARNAAKPRQETKKRLTRGRCGSDSTKDTISAKSANGDT